jgi:NADH:ubiquinone oxidoreductase subunit K
MLLNQFLILAAILFAIGVYGVLARKNGVMVLMSIELILNAVNINLIAFASYWGTVASCQPNVECPATAGPVFALFIIAVAAAEVGVGLAIVLMLFRNKNDINIDDMDLMKG